jgi:hypothetical protein
MPVYFVFDAIVAESQRQLNDTFLKGSTIQMLPLVMDILKINELTSYLMITHTLMANASCVYYTHAST